MKDFYDVFFMARTFAFDGATLSRALRTTFDRRGAPLPTGSPTAFTEEFYGDAAKQRQWKAFLGKVGEADVTDLESVVGMIRAFVQPPMLVAANGTAFNQRWRPGGPWVAT
jgi:hypothetical protein